MTPLLGFMPDADRATPGVLADCMNLIPYISGMEGAPSAFTPAATPALDSECLGAAVTSSLSGTRRVFAGTASDLYELTSGAWANVSRSGSYTGGSDTRWMFAQFGNAALACNGDTIQRSESGAFADIASAPTAEIIFSVGAFVMALNVNDGEVKQDGWHCCAAYDDTDWTVSVATQATSGRLVASAGAITAGARLGEYAIAYKARSIYRGQYVGSPAVWDWVQVPGGDAGCVGKEALCEIGGAHFLVGEDNFYIFNGESPTPIGDNSVRQWFYNNSDPQYRYRTKAVFDRQNNRVWVFFPSVGSQTCNEALVYHVLAKKWGRATLSIQAALNYTSPGVTIDTLTGTIDTLPSVAFDSQYWMSGGQALSAFNTSHQLQLLNGESVSSSMTPCDVGDDDAVSLLKQIRLRFARAPASATCTTSYAMNSGEAFTEDAAGVMNDGKFDVLRSARWHRARIAFTGAVRVTAARIQAKEVSLR
ncbi:hypothetical protein WG922_21595 [Ramlibacter sp. AN1015]|uniref:hypothetical protein n=1 Tax=Ramlibacter sp. AN1015 TaxID=3133428 RepID=UPI0030BCA76B